MLRNLLREPDNRLIIIREERGTGKTILCF